MMNDPRADEQAAAAADAGLCASCRHAQVIESSRGSRFYLCRKSLEDPAYPRYPRLPVVDCAGFDPCAARD
jgi:hypothetical protein